jgi:hypothetical protein
VDHDGERAITIRQHRAICAVSKLVAPHGRCERMTGLKRLDAEKERAETEKN